MCASLLLVVCTAALTILISPLRKEHSISLPINPMAFKKVCITNLFGLSYIVSQVFIGVGHIQYVR